MLNIKKILVGTAAGALLVGSLITPALAANNGTDQFSSIPGASQDGGTCGNSWANDTYSLAFSVHDNGDGTFAVRTDYKNGNFVTLAGGSPGACESTNHHGSTLLAGVAGGFQGFVDGTVTGGSYNPNADLSVCTTVAPCTRTQVIGILFGEGAVYNITSYNFEYSSSDKSLQYRSWHENFNQNSSSEQDIGDIANQ